MNNNEQMEMNFFFWVGDPNNLSAQSVTEEEFNELHEAKRKLNNDYLNVKYDTIAHEAELGYN